MAVDRLHFDFEMGFVQTAQRVGDLVLVPRCRTMSVTGSMQERPCPTENADFADQ